MFGFEFKNKEHRKRGEPVTVPYSNFKGPAGEDYAQTLGCLNNIFINNDPVGFHEITLGENNNIRACLVSFDGLVDSAVVDNHILRPLTQLDIKTLNQLSSQQFLSKVFQVISVEKTVDYNQIIESISYGDTLVLVEGLKECLLFSTRKLNSRAITEPEGEKILSGPREGFTESIATNLSLVRRKIRTEKLNMQYYKLGQKSKTRMCIVYIEGIASPKVIKELYHRLSKIDIDAVLDSNYINELIRDNPKSPFRSTGYTERPDIIAAKLLEGRVAIFVDGTPVVLTIPYLFVENFQSNEDYYMNYYFTSFSRMLRVLAFFITTLLPGVYIAVVAFHQEMLPSPLLISIAAERQSVPLPASLETFIMLIAFEILRETALRMQVNVGQALSVVGALVVGQAAVEAKLIAAPILIVVAMSGITSLLVPKMNSPILILRFGVLILASSLGFLGVTVGCSVILTHVLSLHSFGTWQLAPDTKFSYQGIKDIFFRAPWDQMIKRPQSLAADEIRTKNSGEG